jgi:hypothetical protein
MWKIMSEIGRTVYFTEPGVKNADETLKIAKARAEQLGIKSIIVSTTSGDTGVKVAELFKGYNVVVVTHSDGFKAPNTNELTPENRDKIVKAGGKILTATHAFGGVGRAVSRKFNTIQVDEIIANTLKLFGQGMKVACETSMMAADAGLVRVSEDAIAMGGSSRGVDTAIVVRPAYTRDLFDLKVREILCKPRL